jgi:hypothetical protein
VNRGVVTNNNFGSRQDTSLSENISASDLGEKFFHDKINVKKYFINKGS